MYYAIVVVTACHGGRCEGEGEVDEVTALTVHVCCWHWHCRHVWRDEASTVHRHCHVWTSVEGEVSGGKALSSC